MRGLQGTKVSTDGVIIIQLLHRAINIHFIMISKKLSIYLLSIFFQGSLPPTPFRVLWPPILVHPPQSHSPMGNTPDNCLKIPSIANLILCSLYVINNLILRCICWGKMGQKVVPSLILPAAFTHCWLQRTGQLVVRTAQHITRSELPALAYYCSMGRYMLWFYITITHCLIVKFIWKVLASASFRC